MFGDLFLIIPRDFLEIAIGIALVILFCAGAFGFYLNTPQKASTAIIPAAIWLFVVVCVMRELSHGGKMWQVTLFIVAGSLIAAAAGVILSQRKYRNQ